MNENFKRLVLTIIYPHDITNGFNILLLQCGRVLSLIMPLIYFRN